MSDLPPAQPDRTKFIGGSDIGAVLNISPWRTALQLWADKIEPRVEGGKRKVLRRGQRWEAVVAEMLVEELERQGHKVEIVARNCRYIDPDFPMFACEIDFEVRLDGEEEITNVELKTVHPFKSSEWGQSESDTVPVWYLAQAMWGLGITKRRRCIVAPLFGADEIRTFTVERDEETITALRRRAAEFWGNHVVTKVPPPAVKPRDADVLFPKESEATTLLADDGLTAKLLRLRALDKEINARTAEYETLEFEVKLAMKDAEELHVDVNGEMKVAATWKERSYSWLDQSALREDHPAVHKAYVVRQKRRTFTLKSFAWKGSTE